MPPKDQAFLWDISQACNDILAFVQNLTYERFEESKLVRFAVERQLMVIGEAAAHLSEETRTAEPDVPWSSIIGLRNILAHEYGEVLNQRVWAVVTRRVPELKRNVDALLDSLENTPDS
ncbi:MAG: DUF86 domain-containing protein [Spirochaeta sp.]|nr:DUF86 domain-containing protein [Spirochaeta sp.]